MESPDFSDVPPIVARKLIGVSAFYGRLIYDQMGFLNAISQKRIWLSAAGVYVAFVLGYVGIVYFNNWRITLPGHGAELYPTWPLWLFGCVLAGRTLWRISEARFHEASMNARNALLALAQEPLARPVFVTIRDNDPRNAYSYVAYRALTETEEPTIYR